MTRHITEKGQRYINSLDSARCNHNWHEVSALLRKLAKHASERKCLIQTAQTECQIADYIKKHASRATAVNTSDRNMLLKLIPPLQSAMEAERTTPQDSFQAQVCLAWLRWELLEPAQAAACLPKDFSMTQHLLHVDGQSISAWTDVCIVKGCYMKSAAQTLASETDDALETLKSVFTWVSDPPSHAMSNPQFLYWSELFLRKGAMLSYEIVISQLPSSNESISEFGLKCFRIWGSHPDVKRSDPVLSIESCTPDDPNSRASVWKAYYDFLSIILQEGLTYIPSSDGSKRVQLSTEFRRVEAIRENALLRNTKFPTADSTNTEIELWVDQVIRNWEVLCGVEWCDDDFGEGGQDAISRNVLDILYRAATKTFHSTLILRRLFHVHASLAEFDLAIKALDTYVHLVTSAKSRAEDTEDNEVFIYTLSEGITLLSCFGSRKEAEKTKHLTDVLDATMEIQTGDNVMGTKLNGHSSMGTDFHAKEGVSPFIASIAYRAIGIGLATWAKWTLISESRTDIQVAGISALEKSLASHVGQNDDPATVYALGLLLAETRDIDGAIDLIRRTLSSSNSQGDEIRRASNLATHYEHRDFVPLWHLLALLLSARGDIKTASNACEAAFDIVSTERSITKEISNKSLRGDHDDVQLPPQVAATERNAKSLKMGTREKESVVELRMTQLTLIEVSHGPESALNHSDELISLFGSLFTGVGLGELEEKKKSDHLAPPKSSAGTVRTLRGSIFGRKRSQKLAERGNESASDTSTVPRIPSASLGRELTPDIAAPAIQITNESPNPSKERPNTGTSLGSLRHKDGRPTQKLHRREGSINKAIRRRSLEKSLKASAPSNEQDVDPSPTKSHTTQEGEGLSATNDFPSPTAGHNSSIDAKQTLPLVAHNMEYRKEPVPAGHTKQPPQQDVRLPTSRRFGSPTKALTRFSRMQAQKHGLGLLVKIWLFIAALYRRASLFEDALEAWNEASAQAASIESLVAAQESSSRAFADEGWGGSKSSDEIWADVYAERGYIAQTQSHPYEAMKHLEEALMYYPDHPSATVGLANLLLDIYDQILPTEEPSPSPQPDLSSLSILTQPETENQPSTSTKKDSSNRGSSPQTQKDTTETLHRLAARDRAYGLLCALTKLGTAWDDSEAWFALSRAHEQGGQIQKAKQVLWWCIELEDRRPTRHWWNIGSGGYVL